MASNLLQAAKAGSILGDALSGGPHLRRQQAERSLAIREKEAGISERGVAEQERVGGLQYNEEGTGTEQRRVGVMERQAAVAESDPKVKWGLGMKNPVRITTRATMKQLMKDIPASGPLLGKIEALLDDGSIKTRQQLYDHFKQTKAAGGFVPIVNGIAEQIAKLQEKGDTKSQQQIQKLQAVGDAIQQNGFIDGMFGKPPEKEEGRVDQGSMVEWINPKTGHVLPLGSKVQPPPGYRKVRMGLRMTSTPEGGTTVEQGVIGYPGAKQMPTGQVKELGAIKGYQEIMQKMDEVLSTGKGDLTGPFEFLKKKVDDWDWKAFSSMDRVRLRGLTANLKDYFYTAFGKQLSDKEFKKMEDIQPRMDQDERGFKVAMKTFADAVMAMTKAKAGALRAAGYDVPASIDLDIRSKGTQAAIDVRGEAIMDELVAQGVSEKDAEAAAKAQLEKEFGVRFK